MLEKMLVGMLTLSDIFSKSRNEILEEHRRRQRHVLVSFATVMSCIAVGVMVTWGTESMSGLAAEILRPVALIAGRVYLALGGRHSCGAMSAPSACGDTKAISPDPPRWQIGWHRLTAMGKQNWCNYTVWLPSGCNQLLPT